MLKILAIIGLFVLVGRAASQKAPANPSKARIAKGDGGSEGQKQPHSQSGNQTTPPLVSATPTCDEACQQGRENLQIQNRLVWLTGGLVVVGFLQVASMIWQALLLMRTRNEVHSQVDWMKEQTGRMARQADLMSRQNVIAAASVRAAQTSANAAHAQITAMKNRERARLQIELIDLSFEHGDGELPAQNVKWKLTLHGQSEASFVKGRIFACLDEPEKNEEYSGEYSLGGWPMSELPTILSTSERVYEGEAFIWIKDGYGEDVSYWNEQLLRKVRPARYIYCIGDVEYTDVFGDRWVLPFRRKWNFLPGGGYWWADEGKNEEYKNPN